MLLGEGRGFEIAQEEQIGAFAWQTPTVPGATAYWSATRGTVGENSYVVEFEGRRTPFTHLSQALVLPPGDWQLSWRAKGVRLDTQRGLVWQLRCDPSGAVLAESAPIMGQFEWREQTLAFTVPPDCEGQWRGDPGAGLVRMALDRLADPGNGPPVQRRRRRPAVRGRFRGGALLRHGTDVAGGQQRD